MKKRYTIFALVGASIFTIFAILQINDATQFGNLSWWLWFILYLFCASLCTHSAFFPILRSTLLIASGFFWGALVFKMQDAHGNILWHTLALDSLINPTDRQMIQQTNESAGLLICAIWLSLLMLKKKD